MKISKLFHSLYAVVMALPVLIIPIFALNILHKEVNAISLEVQEKIKVNFNQLIKNGNFEDNTLWRSSSSVSVSIDNNQASITPNTTTNRFELYQSGLTLYSNHVYLNKYTYSSDLNLTTWLSSTNTYQISGTSGTYVSTFTNNIDTTNGFFDIYFSASFDSTNFVITMNAQLFDLTQMFGSGNEPSIDDFNLIFSNDYYDYTLSDEMLVNKSSLTIFNNTDIGSQFIYSMYKPVNDYFRFGEFFGLSGMYDWFQLNIFNGTAPLSFFIVFNVMVYWLFISLFWLIFDILMFLPLLAHKWIDKARME